MAKILFACGVLLSFTVFADPATPLHSIQIEDFTPEALEGPQTLFDRAVAAGDPVYFVINSNGGSTSAGLDFIVHIEQAKKTKGVRVTCAVDYRAYSMAFVFLEAVCDERMMTKRSTLLAHNCSVASIGGTAEQMEQTLSFMRAINRGMAEIVARRLSISLKDYQRKIDGKDWSFAWEEALKVGAVDRTIEAEDVPPFATADAPAARRFLWFLPGR